MNKNVLIINKDGNVAAEIQEHLKNPLSKIVCVPTVRAAAPYLASEEYCLIILDASISSQEDEHLIQIVKRAKTTPILVLSSEFDPAERLQSLQSGAHAYMGKPYSLEECLAQAHALIQLYCKLKSPSEICYTLAFGKNLVIDPLSRRVLLNGKDLRLTRKEFDLLFCLASNPGQVFSREQLYDHVWDEHTNYNVDEAVKAQIKTLRQKLSITGNEYIKNVWGIGYRFHTEPDDE